MLGVFKCVNECAKTFSIAGGLFLSFLVVFIILNIHQNTLQINKLFLFVIVCCEMFLFTV